MIKGRFEFIHLGIYIAVDLDERRSPISLAHHGRAEGLEVALALSRHLQRQLPGLVEGIVAQMPVLQILPHRLHKGEGVLPAPDRLLYVQHEFEPAIPQPFLQLPSESGRMEEAPAHVFQAQGDAVLRRRVQQLPEDRGDPLHLQILGRAAQVGRTVHHVVGGAQDAACVQRLPVHREGVRLLPGMDGEELGLELVAHGMDAVDFKSCVVDAAFQQAHEVRPILREGI